MFSPFGTVMQRSCCSFLRISLTSHPSFHPIWQLLLGGNRITSLGSELFPGLRITTLNFSNNEIVNIVADAFNKVQVTELDLSNNPVGTWDPDLGRIFSHAG